MLAVEFITDHSVGSPAHKVMQSKARLSISERSVAPEGRQIRRPFLHFLNELEPDLGACLLNPPNDATVASLDKIRTKY